MFSKRQRRAGNPYVRFELIVTHGTRSEVTVVYKKRENLAFTGI